MIRIVECEKIVIVGGGRGGSGQKRLKLPKVTLYICIEEGALGGHASARSPDLALTYMCKRRALSEAVPPLVARAIYKYCRSLS